MYECPVGVADGALADACWLEVFGVLAGKEPGDLCGMAGVVDLLGAGRGAVTAEVLPRHAMGEEDPDRGAAFAAYREGLLVLGDRGVLGLSASSGSRRRAAPPR